MHAWLPENEGHAWLPENEGQAWLPENEARGSFLIMDQILSQGAVKRHIVLSVASRDIANDLPHRPPRTMQVSVARGDEEVMKKTLTPQEIQEVWKCVYVNSITTGFMQTGVSGNLVVACR